MKGGGFADGLFVERMPVNHTVLLETVENFGKFVTSTIFLFPNVIVVLLNVVDAIDFIDAFEENDVRVKFFAFGSFFHSINFAGKEMSKFVIMRAAFKGIFFVGFL